MSCAPDTRAASRAARGAARAERLRSALGLALALGVAAPASAVELFDGDVQIHGFVEAQLRGVASNYSADDGWDLTQWYNVANLELELDLAPEGVGPFDYVGGFVRVEARYDCVWKRACGMARSAHAFGNRAKRLPERMSDARRPGLIGVIEPFDYEVSGGQLVLGRNLGDTRPRIQVPLAQRPRAFGPLVADQPVPKQRYLGRIWNLPGLGDLFFAGRGVDLEFGSADDPGLYVLEHFLDHRFGLRGTRGAFNGVGTQVLGPYRPKDKIRPFGVLRDRANPFRADDLHPVLVNDEGVPHRGLGALPYRPAPRFAFDDASAPPDAARGLFLPNAGLRPLLRDRDFDAWGQNFSENALAWNHGASQQDERELKEAYLDLEMLRNRLWLRLGKQTIVWGKTELFRNQDRFNPQDLGLSSLPSLEESRIALWAARAVYSFYDVGPLSDLRLELAANLDDFEPLDAGRCGEPYAPRPVCTLNFGIFAHGLTGTGLAGEFRPPDPWDDLRGLEGGVRIEFRYDRLSFSITDFYGFDDLPFARQVYRFERNVDPLTGWPRRGLARGGCDPDSAGGDLSGCLGAVARDANGRGFVDDGDLHRSLVLRDHPANQQLFASICAASIGISDLEPDACAFNAWNSQRISDPDMAAAPRLSMAFSAMLGGSGFESSQRNGRFPFVNGKLVLLSLGRFPDMTGAIPSTGPPLGAGCQGQPQVCDEDDMPLVPLVLDPGDEARGPGDPASRDHYGSQLRDEDLAFFGFAADPIWILWGNAGLAPRLSDEQEALLGCGRFYGTHCDIHGFDLMNAEASAFFQSWPGFEGSGGRFWDTFGTNFDTLAPGEPLVAQPGTLGFGGGPVCTRFTGGRLRVLPGCRGPFRADGSPDMDYRPAADGTPPSEDPSNPQVAPRQNGAPGAATPAFLGGHPFTGQAWQSELAAVSWNALMVFVALSIGDDADDDGITDPPDPIFLDPGETRFSGRRDEFDPRDPYNRFRCSFRNPLPCKNVANLLLTTLAGKRVVRAGGNGRFGRRDFAWHGGGVLAGDYDKRNNFGFSMDFAEDFTQSNWGFEFLWAEGVKMLDNDRIDNVNEAQQFNLTLSVDRPTFARFLNAGRTFFMNAQLFVQYIDGYHESFVSTGPFNTRATFSVSTGYWQDRMLPSLTLVHDFPSDSGGILPSLGFRYTESFSVTVGAAIFYGRTLSREAPLVGAGSAAGGAGRGAQRSYVEPGLSSIRDRDEIYLRLRYTF